jgi:hypothetical protein
MTIHGFFTYGRIYWALIQSVTTFYSSLLHTHTHTHTHTSVHSYVYTNRCSEAASNDDLPLPLGSRTTRGLNYQLLTATAHND